MLKLCIKSAVLTEADLQRWDRMMELSNVRDESVTPFVELDFSVVGRTLPADHGYALYGGLSEVVPAVHEAEWLGIHTLVGTKDGKGNLLLSHEPQLHLRLPIDKIPLIYPLAGKRIAVQDHSLRLGIPQIRMLQPSPHLRARLVTLKLAGSGGKSAEAKSFLAGVERQLEALEIQGTVCLELAKEKDELDPYARRVVRIRGKAITGYGVYVSGLSDQDSLKLQAVGVGGRRRMGCGLFVPIGERES
jgi:CRISPR-associated protein Cas6